MTDRFAVYREALTHSSWTAERGEPHNERLEFLGDAVLQATSSHMLFELYPDAPEGELTRVRKQVVNNRFLAGLARELGLQRLLRLGRGEELTGGRDRNRNLAGAYEALLGAVFLDQGYGAAAALVRAVVQPRLLEASRLRNPMQALQEWSQKRTHTVPEYVDLDDEGPDHDKQFTVEVRTDAGARGRGKGRSKKEARLAAAEHALVQIEAAEEGAGAGAAELAAP